MNVKFKITSRNLLLVSEKVIDYSMPKFINGFSPQTICFIVV